MEEVEVREIDVTEKKPPKLFLSYSWSNADHESWVVNLATGLREAGVDVILDKWDLKEGHDAFQFMERMVTDPEIQKVAMICDPVYASKADGRSGGVGTETQIISGEIYEKSDQDKFVAVISERDIEGKPVVPTYYKSRIFIDLSDDDQYAKNFEQLLRWVFDKPLFRKPELGKTPEFLNDNALQMGTSFLFKRAVDAIRNGKTYANGATQEYFTTFTENLERFRISTNGNPGYDEEVISNIEEFIPYRNEVLQLISAIVQYGGEENSRNIIHRFLEGVLPYTARPENITSYRETDFDNFKFIVHELFLCTLALALRYERFEYATHLLGTGYYQEQKAQQGMPQLETFTVFRGYVESLDHRNTRLKLNKLSLHADILKGRVFTPSLSFRNIMQADFVAYLRSMLDTFPDKSYSYWWPITLLYASRWDGVFEVFSRAQSREYFEKLKPVLGIENKEKIDLLIESFRKGELEPPKWQFQSLNSAACMGYETLATRR